MFKYILKKPLYIIIPLLNFTFLLMLYLQLNYLAIIFILAFNGVFIYLILIKKEDVDLLKKEKSDLIESKTNAVEYIDALWVSQNKIIQNEKLTSLNSLVAGVAHELNTPLGITLTGITYLEELLKNDKELTDTIPMVNMTLENIIKSITLLKYFREIADTEPNINISKVDIKDFLEFVISGVEQDKRMNSNIKIKYKIQSDFSLNVSQTTLSVILINIIENAYDFAFGINDKGLININAEKYGQDLIIHIDDNGTGIPENIIKKIFDPFFTTKRRSEHYGLGLAISRNLVLRHYNGELKVNSKPKEGSKFKIVIPGIICN